MQDPVTRMPRPEAAAERVGPEAPDAAVVGDDSTAAGASLAQGAANERAERVREGFGALLGPDAVEAGSPRWKVGQ